MHTSFGEREREKRVRIDTTKCMCVRVLHDGGLEASGVLIGAVIS